MFSSVHLTIERLGQRGEGIATCNGRPVFVAHALPGDEIAAEVDGDRGRIVEILRPSALRRKPVCRWYGTCGGCAVQGFDEDAYAAWKRGLVVQALQHAGLEADVAALVDAHGNGRRRATFHARYEKDGLGRITTRSGYMRARSHDIVTIDECPILAPAMADAPAIAAAVAQVLAVMEKPLDMQVTATDEGLDMDLRGCGRLPEDMVQQLVACTGEHDLARLSNHGDVLIERRPARIRVGSMQVHLPPGAFLQATEAGESLLSDAVCSAVGKARRIADLFAGIGTFALRLADKASVNAVEADEQALAALKRAANAAGGGHQVEAVRRDLFRRPLPGQELKQFDAIVFDPPRAGAEAQSRELAVSAVPKVIAVSCNAQTFARDAHILTSGGYRLESVTPFDQFRYSPHVEIVGVFTKNVPRKQPRKLLG